MLHRKMNSHKYDPMKITYVGVTIVQSYTENLPSVFNANSNKQMIFSLVLW